MQPGRGLKPGPLDRSRHRAVAVPTELSGPLIPYSPSTCTLPVTLTSPFTLTRIPRESQELLPAIRAGTQK